MRGFNRMERAKLLLVNSESNNSVHSVLSEQGYQVQLASTPEDTILSILEGDPKVVIWSEGLDHLTEWQRVKAALEARTPFLSVSTKWTHTEDKSLAKAEEPFSLDETLPVTNAEGLLSRLQSIALQPAQNQHFYTKVGNKLRRINLSDIRYIQVEGKYSAIQLESRQYHVKASLKDLLIILASADFVRVSRNYVVNLNHINHIDVYQSTVHIGGEDVPVSRTYKDNLMKNVRLL